MEKKERELLTTFFKNNEDLIRAAISALGDEDLSQSMAKVARKSRSKNAYTINKQGNYSMYDVLEKFVEYRLDNSSDSVQVIDQEIGGFINSNRVNVSDDTKKPVFQEGTKPHGTFTFKGREIRYTKQWSDSGNYPTFSRFREGVSNKYSNSKFKFQIDVI